MKTWKVLIPTLVLGLGACESAGRPSGGDVVAQAAGYEFTAQTAAEILAPCVLPPRVGRLGGVVAPRERENGDAKQGDACVHLASIAQPRRGPCGRGTVSAAGPPSSR